jgi:hypothetical protein
MPENYKGNPIKIEHKYQCLKTTRAIFYFYWIALVVFMQ